MSRSLEVAHAKLTVHLHITGTRADGYHLIDAEMVSLDLADELTFEPAENTEIEITGIEAAGIPVGPANLVAKALTLAGRSARVRIDKHIPVGGGLGGGSSNAAAALRWAGMSDLDRAASVGADVPFCLVGGRARVRGIGELVEPMPSLTRTFTLLLPPFGVDTVAVYKAFDELDSRGQARTSEVNHLEAAAIAVEPRLTFWRDRLAELTGAQPRLAGSGSTWFVEGTFPEPDLSALTAPTLAVSARSLLGCGQQARWILAKEVAATD